jgi:hypothetical protein
LVSRLRVACRVFSFVTTGLNIKSGNDANNRISFSRRDRARAMPRHYEIRSRMEPTGPAFGRPADRLRAIRATTLRKKKGKRNAGRRTSMSRIERMRPRVQRDALACRRSTTALAAATERHRSAPANALPRTGLDRSGRYPLPAVPVQRVAPQTGHNPGRAYYPGAARERR